MIGGLLGGGGGGGAGADGAPANRNRIINGNFAVNQRRVSGTVSLSAGEYGHDRWKAGASGCTYTFATSENVTTITITAGSLIQVISGDDLQSGTHVLSWEGTLQFKIDGGTAGDSGMTGTVTGGTNVEVETSSTGEMSLVQFELGSVVTPFEIRDDEKRRCLNYFWRKWNDQSPAYLCSAGCYNSSVCLGYIDFPAEMRVTPTAGYSAIGDFSFYGSSAEKVGFTNLNFIEDTNGSRISMSTTWSLTQGDGGLMAFKSTAAATAYIEFNAEL